VDFLIQNPEQVITICSVAEKMWWWPHPCWRLSKKARRYESKSKMVTTAGSGAARRRFSQHPEPGEGSVPHHTRPEATRGRLRCHPHRRSRCAGHECGGKRCGALLITKASRIRVARMLSSASLKEILFSSTGMTWWDGESSGSEIGTARYEFREEDFARIAENSPLPYQGADCHRRLGHLPEIEH